MRGSVKGTRLAEFAYNDAAAKQLFNQLEEGFAIRSSLCHSCVPENGELFTDLRGIFSTK